MLKKVLVIEAHSDDSAISIGGFLEKFKEVYEYHFCLVANSDLHLYHYGEVKRAQRLREYESFVNHFNGTFHKTKSLPFDYDSLLDTLPKRDLVKAVEEVIEKVKPEILICQGPSFHHDHTLVYEAVIAATRPTARHCPGTIYVMENPTYVHSIGPQTDFFPNCYVELSKDVLSRKLDNYKKYFPSQIREDENYLSEKGLRAWARYRGIESRCQYAEALKIHTRVI